MNRRSALLLAALAAVACKRDKNVPHTPATATSHLPTACQAVARVDFQALLRAPGVKEHLAAHRASDEAKGQVDRQPRNESKIFEFLQEAGLDPKQNVKEIALCLSDSVGASSGRASFLIAIGGDLGGTELLPAMEKFAPADAKFEAQVVDGQKVLSRGQRLWSQARDGVVLFSDSSELLKLGLKGTWQHYQTLNMPKADVALVATRRVFETLGGQSAKYPLPMLQGLGIAQHLSLTINFNDGKIDGTVTLPAASDAQSLSDNWNKFLAPFRDEQGKSVLAKQLPPALLDTLHRATIQPKDKVVDVKLQLPSSAFEQVFHTVALYSGLETAHAK